MNEIKYVGWFSDLPHGRADSPELASNLHKLSPDQAERIAKYLESGTVIAETTGAMLRDEIDPTHPDIGPFRTLTDGEYVWPSDLAFYVRKYAPNIGVDMEATVATGPRSPLSEDEIDRVVESMLG